MAAEPLPERFTAAMAALAPFEKSPRIAVAVSGGPDSRALGLLAGAWCRQQNGQLLTLLVDHQLRPESASEISQTVEWLASQGITAEALKVTVGDGNLQAEARRARYRAMTERCRERGILHLLLGHHAGDQRETLLMRLARGSGARGLSGIRPVEHRRTLRLLRPLLGIEPEELTAYLAVLGHTAIDDPSNRNERFARTHLRPVARQLRDERGWSAERLERQLGQLRAAADDEQRRYARFLARHARFFPAGFVRFDRAVFETLPDTQAIYLLRRLLTAIRGHGMVRWAEAERLRSLLPEQDGAGSLHGCRLVAEGPHLFVCRAPLADEAAPLIPGRWDGRFDVLKEEPGTILAYPRKRWAAARAFARDRGMADALPQAVWEAVPALWQEERITGLPGILAPAQGAVRFRPEESAT